MNSMEHQSCESLFSYVGELGIKHKHFILEWYFVRSLVRSSHLMGNRKIVTSHYRAIDLWCDAWNRQLNARQRHLFVIFPSRALRKYFGDSIRTYNTHTHAHDCFWFFGCSFVAFRERDLFYVFLLALLLFNALEMPHFISSFLWKWNVYVCV